MTLQDEKAIAWEEGFDAALRRYGLKLADIVRKDFMEMDNPYRTASTPENPWYYDRLKVK